MPTHTTPSTASKLPARLKTNTDLVRYLMEYSPSGALCQAFIVQAIQNAAEHTAAVDPAELNTGLVNGEAWHRCAVFIRDAMAEFYGRR